VGRPILIERNENGGRWSRQVAKVRGGKDAEELVSNTQWEKRGIVIFRRRRGQRRGGGYLCVLYEGSGGQ